MYKVRYHSWHSYSLCFLVLPLQYQKKNQLKIQTVLVSVLSVCSSFETNKLLENSYRIVKRGGQNRKRRKNAKSLASVFLHQAMGFVSKSNNEMKRSKQNKTNNNNKQSKSKQEQKRLRRASMMHVWHHVIATLMECLNQR